MDETGDLDGDAGGKKKAGSRKAGGTGRLRKLRPGAEEQAAMVRALVKAGMAQEKAARIRVPAFGALVVKPACGRKPEKTKHARRGKAFVLADKEQHRKYFDILMATLRHRG